VNVGDALRELEKPEARFASAFIGHDEDDSMFRVQPELSRFSIVVAKLARCRNRDALETVILQREIAAKVTEKELQEIQAKASSLDGQEVAMVVKVGDQNQLFESITVQKIADKLKEAGFEIDKKQINLKEPIKDLGDYMLKINFPHNLEAEIKLTVSAE